MRLKSSECRDTLGGVNSVNMEMYLEVADWKRDMTG